MITLPSPARFAYLRSFWLVMSCSSGLLIEVVLSQMTSARWFGFGLILAPIVALPGVLRPQTVSFPYRVWNKTARILAKYARLSLIGICFFFIFVVVGLTGGSLKLSCPRLGQSLWVPLDSLRPTTYASQHTLSNDCSARKGWISTIFSWSLHSGNLWACVLVPFLMLLSVLETEDSDNRSLTDIYTLF